MRSSCSRSKDTRMYGNAGYENLRGRARGRIAIGLFHYKSFAADKAALSEKASAEDYENVDSLLAFANAVWY